MAGAGFLGALAGVGQGTAQVGDTLLKSSLQARAQAEKDARTQRIAEYKVAATAQSEADKYARERGDKVTDAEAKRQHDLELERMRDANKRGQISLRESLKGKGKKDGKEDGGGAGIPAYNALKGGLKDMFSRMDPAGNFTMPEDSDRDYGMSLEIGDDLMARGVLPGRATNMAYAAVRGPLNESDAKLKAEKEAKEKFGGWTEGSKRDALVAKRVPELMTESRKAFEEYNAMMRKPATKAAARPASSGAGQRASAPPAAIEHLRKNPQFKEAFMTKYGYLPEGM
jgi:hypothetical protein